MIALKVALTFTLVTGLWHWLYAQNPWWFSRAVEMSLGCAILTTAFAWLIAIWVTL